MAKDLPVHTQAGMQRVPQGDLIRPSRKTNGAGVQAEDTKICVVMVGLPARGKSLIAQKGVYGVMRSVNTEANTTYSCSLFALALNQSQNLQCGNLPPHSHA